METIVDYRIICTNNPAQLATEVQALINQGWQPHGFMTVTIKRLQNHFSGAQHVGAVNHAEYTQVMIMVKGNATKH